MLIIKSLIWLKFWNEFHLGRGGGWSDKEDLGHCLLRAQFFDLANAFFKHVSCQTAQSLMRGNSHHKQLGVCVCV